MKKFELRNIIRKVIKEQLRGTPQKTKGFQGFQNHQIPCCNLIGFQKDCCKAGNDLCCKWGEPCCKKNPIWLQEKGISLF